METRPDSSENAAQRARLELLLAGTSSPVALRSLQDYALAYVECFRGNVLQLEHEWDFLAAILHQAWRDERYEVVVRLASALAYPAGRRDLTEARRLLHLGIVASRRTGDQSHFAALLNRLGGLVFVHGRYHQGYRLWHTGLYAVETEGQPGLWEPLTSFAQIADLLGNYASAQHFLETFYGKGRTVESDGLAVALFVRGLYARFTSHMEKAEEDFSHCLRLLAPQRSGAPLLATRQLFFVVVQAELARAQGNYARAQQYSETALALARAFGDHYTSAILLVDQGLFAWRQGWYDEVRRVFPSLREIERQVAFPNVAEVNRLLAQQLSEQNLSLDEPRPAHVDITADPLSQREREVLQLVADGCTSREIAARLVITTATVKKHLEHIYLRLDVHNRTSAVLQGRKLKIIS